MADPLELDRGTEMARYVLDRVVEDLGLLLDRPLALETVAVERSAHKVAGERLIHIAFKLAVTVGGVAHHGALLVPLPDAIGFACYLMMIPDDVVATRRKQKELDRSTKDAMVEVGNLIGGSVDGALRELTDKGASARSEGCQGVKPYKAPGFPRVEGTDLLVARARAKLHTYPPFDLLLMLPAIDLPAPPE
jgi:hypothetical protein